MKLQITKPTEVDVKFLKVFGGDRLRADDILITDKNLNILEFDDMKELLTRFPMFEDPWRPGEFSLIIDVATGRIANWPVGHHCDFTTIKIVDGGSYILSDVDGEVVAYYDGYVPECLQIEEEGYGDYWEFCVNDNGYIRDWEFGQSDLDELLKINQDE